MELLSGNEAIAQGAWEAGCRIGVAYPGTPSTETLETFAKMDGVYAEWCVNEKVAVEVGVGASAAGARVLALSAPVRYIHSACSGAKYDDLEQVFALASALAERGF